jgi:alanyl-tRNA synthetase
LVEGGAISNDKIRTLYESHGITREEIKAKAEEMGAEIKLPPEELEEINRRRTPRGPGIGVDTTNIKETEKLFYNEGLLETSAKMVKKLDAHRIILNKTIFYPEMGGQKPDGGYIDSVKVNDVRIYDGVIVHFLDSEIKKGIGDTVKLKIDSERRELLRRHHTATHIINRAAKKILGEFVNQAGAEKDVDSARLDITYYDKLSDEQLLAIERLANDVVASDMEISSEVMGRTEAESRYGMNIYQGGTAPSANIRIVKIGSYDAEACGGLHCNRTGQVGLIKIMKSERIQDGVVRLEFAAYRPAIAYVQSLDETARSLSRLWGVKYEEIYKTANRFFSDYKRYRELYERAEEERLYYNIIKSDQKDPIALRTDVENAGVMIKVLKNAQKAPGERAVVISGKSISVGYPKSDNIRALLTKEHKVVEDKGDFLLSHD